MMALLMRKKLLDTLEHFLQKHQSERTQAQLILIKMDSMILPKKMELRIRRLQTQMAIQ